jgi:hypothetical protein
LTALFGFGVAEAVMRFAESVTAVVMALGLSVGTAGQQPSTVDVNRLGPQVGTAVPPFSLQDQTGRLQTLQSVMGAKGAILVFFRSADW